MANKKDFSLYENARECLRNKDINIKNFIDYMLDRTSEMFVYKGLPETIPARELEKILQENGGAFITKKPNGVLYAFNGSKGGELDVYNNPTKIIINSPALNYNASLDINTDGVYIRNDSRGVGLLPMIKKYGVMLCDSEISLNMISVLLRALFLISACDDKTRESADLFIKKLVNGDYSIIGDSAFFDGVKLQTAQNSNANTITQFIELNQYIKATAYNELGLNANFNMKRERLTAGEIELNNDALLPLIDDFINNRREGVEKINKMFDTNISVELGGVWRAERENIENTTATLNIETLADAMKAPAEKMEGGNNDKNTVINKGGKNPSLAVERDNQSGSLSDKKDSGDSEKLQDKTPENKKDQPKK